MLREVMEVSTEMICREMEISLTNVWAMLYLSRMESRQCLDQNGAGRAWGNDADMHASNRYQGGYWEAQSLPVCLRRGRAHWHTIACHHISLIFFSIHTAPSLASLRSRTAASRPC